MQAFSIESLLEQHKEAGRLYKEFLRVEALSVGLYVLPAGGTDPQNPHTEDEVYYVVSGSAVIMIGADELQVEAGSIIYVPAGVAHRFHSITENLTLMVFFAPAEYSQGSRLT